ncbi:glucosamine-6-phosphate deaminase [Lihuaxuella thermophila]|uniref:Glucosamine-6-phosphate deaminase n=1 Tax=Lihuaxuella thermophila TaxID=1173111 RepID=A0A1H8E1B1_9BACL|nr:glucosamine-6-phosphate deaminase [Lihuaxuella thermophila]SEN13369.1 glucosamine-6-phosphate deaminase [Lihuaxuella thermophila]
MRENIQPVHTERIDHLQVHVYANRTLLGTAAGMDVAEKMKQLLTEQERIRMIFAAAPSQNEFLAELVRAEGIDWSRVTAFHMDEYIGLSEDAPERFSRFLRERLFERVHPGEVHLINSSPSVAEECKRYADLIKAAPIDIVCLGIGENGHIAFNDPPVADFQDKHIMKPVKLDEACRQQQVNDGCFPDIRAVPTHALTLTIPALMSGKHLYCIVPGASKRAAVERTLYGPVSTDCPASILRRHPRAVLYVDTDSYGRATG